MKQQAPPQLSVSEIPSKHFDTRNTETIDTLVIHSMYCPGAPDPFSPVSCKELLDQYEVSAHYLIDREGKIWQLVDEKARAWHAGVSKMPFSDDDREAANHFSIGIELFAMEESGYTDAQYRTLAALTMAILSRHPIRNVVGHSDIAPERKTDPWGFDWGRYKELLGESCAAVRFCR